MRTRPGWAVMFGIGGLMLPLAALRVAAQDQRTAILNAERATAEQSRDSGFAGAILGNIHGDGILLWPGAPVVAGAADLKRFFASRQIESVYLAWQPLGIEVARDSTLAATWGVAAASASRNATASHQRSQSHRKGRRLSRGLALASGGCRRRRHR